MFFAKNQQYNAIKVIADLIKKAQKSIVIIDAYVGDATLDLLTEKRKGVTAKILTGDKSTSAAFILYARKFVWQHNDLSIASTVDFHDRFLIIDDTEVYLSGTSLKDIGSKACMFVPLTVPEAINDMKKFFIEQWDKAEVIL